jgi:hypothetical protein
MLGIAEVYLKVFIPLLIFQRNPVLEEWKNGENSH